jgi:hypothetical protein
MGIWQKYPIVSKEGVSQHRGKLTIGENDKLSLSSLKIKNNSQKHTKLKNFEFMKNKI